MAFVDVNGVRLHVIEEGAGTPLLLLHGFTGTAAGWDQVAAALSSGWRTIRVDLLGHGLSSAPADPKRYSLPNAATDLVALLDKLEIKSCVVAGYSFGGRVALHLGLAAPERIRGLILESTSPGIADPKERDARRKADEALAQKLEQEGIASFVDYWENLPLFATQKSLSQDVQAAVRRERLEQSPLGLANSLRGAGAATQEDLFPRLAELAMPVFLIAGRLDEKYCRIAGAMHEVLPDSQLCIVEEAGHNVHLERPGTYIREVEMFLRKLPERVS